METPHEERQPSNTAKMLEDKLHAIAVQLGKLAEFTLWMKARIEVEINKDAEKKGGEP